MGKLVRQPAARTQPAKPRLLLVRQPVKSVRPEEEADPTPVRLTIGIIAGLGAIGLVWLLGHLGYRLGFGPMMRVPQLSLDAGGALAAGTLMMASIPRMILAAGANSAVGLMAGFLAIAIPAGALSAAKPLRPGGPRPSTAVITFAALGAALAGLHTLGMVWWAASPLRLGMLGELPLAAGDLEPWLEALAAVAGLDVLGVIATALWVVLVMRLPTPLWLKALSASVTLFGLAIITVAFAASNGAASQLTVERSRAQIDDGGRLRLLIGSTEHQVALMELQDEIIVIELRDRPSVLKVIDRETVAEFVDAGRPAE